MVRISERVLSRAATILLLLAAGMLLYSARSIIALEWQGPVTDDVLLYTIVGRGIVNGLVPYKDLFEARPPGMFLIIATSLKAFGDLRLLTFISHVTYVVIPTGLVWIAWRSNRGASRDACWWATTTALVGGLILALFLEERAGAAETESIGSLFGVLYVYSLMVEPATRWRQRLLLVGRSIAMTAAIGLKEPFLFVLIACGIVLARDMRSFTRNVLLPLGLALVIGVIVLALLGELFPYVTTYLPTMLSSRLEGTKVAIEPLWYRAIDIRRIFGNIVIYTTTAFFGLWLIVTWIFMAVLKLGEERQYPTKAYVLFFLACLIVWHAIDVITIALYARLIDYEFIGGVITTTIVIAGTTAVGIVVLWRRYPHVWRQFTVPALSLILVCTAVGVGGRYNDYHYAFAVPYYAALATLLFSRLQAIVLWKPVLATTSILFILTGLTYSTGSTHLEHLQTSVSYADGSNAPTINQVDSLLDSCGFSRYTGVDTFQILALAKHSPIGPMAELNKHDYLGRAHPLYLRTAGNILNDTDVIIEHTPMEDVHPILPTLRDTAFNTQVPDCAKSFLPMEGLQFYFRQPGVPRTLEVYYK